MSDRPDLQHIVRHQASLLAELNSRQAVVRDRVRSVPGGYATGLYLYGAPGTAKSHTVRTLLDTEFGGDYVYMRGHITPLGLFELLQENRDRTIVLDDVSSLFRQQTALQILLAALEHSTAPDAGRRVQYRRKDQVMSFDFTGGVICISNLELHNDELLAAFKSRVNVLNYAPTDAQLAALMLHVADSGWPVGASAQTIPPAQARTVAEFVLEAILQRGCPVDLRVLFDKAFASYEQWRDEETELDWRDLVIAAIDEHLIAVQHPPAVRVSRAERLEGERTTVHEILAQHPADRAAQVDAWIRRTGKSRRSFYRRLDEIVGAAN